MSGAQLGSGAAANADAYANMAALGTPQAPMPNSSMFGVPPYNPTAPSAAGGGGFDLKSPLAGFALNMAQQQLLGPRKGMVPTPQHYMGLQIPQAAVRNPYGYKLG